LNRISKNTPQQQAGSGYGLPPKNDRAFADALADLVAARKTDAIASSFATEGSLAIARIAWPGTTLGLHCCRNDDGDYQRKGQSRRILEQQLSAGNDWQGASQAFVILDKVKTLELLDCQPDKINVHGFIKLFLKPGAYSFGRSFSVALLPNQRGGVIEAMGLVRFPIVDKSLVVQLTNHKPVDARTRHYDSAFHQDSPPFIGNSESRPFLP
jgi:hypothetical protein